MTLKDLATKGPKPVWVRYLLLIGLFTILTRAVLDSRFSHSALLYVLIPYLVAIAIYIFVPQPKGVSRTKRFLKHMLAALTVMLASSALLFEGFLCVLMFLPIYTLVAAITFALSPKQVSEQDRISDTFKASVLPLLVVVMSLEGTARPLSFDRTKTVTQSKIVNADVATLKANLAMPIHMDEDRSAFLSLFPLPTHVEAGTLNVGDVHKAYFTYKRWGFMNVHKGETWVKIAEVSDKHVRTEIVKDTSYFSIYLTVSGTQIDFEPIDAHRTKVTLNVTYTRLLDPAWYFGPMQNAAMTESADYLIDHVITRAPKDAEL